MENEKKVIVTESIMLYPRGDKEEVNRVYTYLRNGMKAQAQMMNIAMSQRYSIYMSNPITRKEWQDLDETERLNKEAEAKLKRSELIKELNLLTGRVPGSPKGSLYDDIVDVDLLPTGIGIGAFVIQAVKNKFDKSLKDGLLYGKVSLPTYKDTAPLMVEKKFIQVVGQSLFKQNGEFIKKSSTGFYHGYDTDEEFYQALINDEKPKLYLKFANNIDFEVILGNPRKSARLRQNISGIFTGEFNGCSPTIGFDKSGRKIVLNLPIEMKAKVHELDESKVVGVDLGLAVPVVCATNFNVYSREKIGNYNDFLRRRVAIQNERKRIQSSLVTAKGGHGRKQKLQKLEMLKKRERDFVKTYNHMLSSKVVEYAISQNAKYIYMEDLSGFSESEKKQFVLRNWSYYELQHMIEYKAQLHNIIVKYVCPTFTSQVCSICGHKGNRVSQAIFECTNPDCKCHSMYEVDGRKIGADFNAARNIAMSTDFKDDICFNRLVSVKTDFVKEDNVLLAQGSDYRMIVKKNGIVKVMCDDDYFHEFDILDIESCVDKSVFTDIKKKIKK